MGFRGAIILGTLRGVQNTFQNCVYKEQEPIAFTNSLLPLLMVACQISPTHTLSPLNVWAVRKCR